MCFGLSTLLTGSLILLLVASEYDPQSQLQASALLSHSAKTLNLADGNRSPVHRGSGRCEFGQAFDFSYAAG